jgi:hypothetical protein
MKRFYMAEGKETPDGEYMLVAEHEKVLNQSVPAAYEKRLQQFDVLRRYVYRTLAQTHQVLWEVDRIPELGCTPQPFDLPPGVEPRLKTLQDAAGAVRIALKDFYPHGENAAAAIMAMLKEPQP